MNGKLIALLAVCLLAACQRTPETRPAAQKDVAVAAPEEEQDLEKALTRAVFGNAALVNGREVLGFKDLGHGKAALVISEIPQGSPEPGMRDMALQATISAFLLDKVDGKWTVTRRHESIADMGSNGNAGELTWVTLGAGKPGFAIVDESGNRGQSVKSLALFDLTAKDMRALAGKPILVHSDNDGDCEGERPHCWNISGEWRLVQNQGQAYADLEIAFSGVVEQRSEDAKQKADALTDAAGAEPSYDEYLAALGPRDQRKVKSTARYALSEKGIRLASGENPAETSDGE
ncbi:hypothetical protein [Duganella sp. Root198D2]|uniref:hypothetical protein n=1 Tax=Duganella sp. Root198D2 TaxID=1736489 RepID=UPI0012E3ABFD|nr:hypothetical protein [Duganella sp. Root198D2]